MVESESPSAFSTPSSNLCQDTLEEAEEDDEHKNIHKFAYPSDKKRAEDDSYIQKLLHREISTSQSFQLMMISNWIEKARLGSIKWVFDTRALLGFQFQTAYLSVIYFDRFLSRKIIDGEKYWAVRLLSVACLSLAAKMEECKVPLLTDFPLEDYKFESKVIQRMELLVLSTLEWRMVSITPFDYLHYFISKFCDQSSAQKVIPRIIDLILAITEDKKFLSYRPSVIAAAATLLALDQKLTRQCLEFRINEFASGTLQIEDVFCCYNRMQELDKESIKLPRYDLSPNLSSIQLGGADAFGNSGVMSAVSTKRKSLTFNDVDQNCDMPDAKKPHERVP